ncbi:MAG: hypothetical protein Q8O68_00815 [Candidatus Daviesbacteria bacterium]|nr:hypothetical protein [Candidatus Daviesbacteria bacterium]
MAKLDLKEAGAIVAGGLAGALISSYGSNALSASLTKDDRTLVAGVATTEPSDVSFWKKAPAIDLGLGLVAGAVAVMALKQPKLRMVKTGLLSASAFLIANGVVDMVRESGVNDAEKAYNGRVTNTPIPAADMGVMDARGPGPLSRVRAMNRFQAMSAPRALQRAQTIAAQGEQVALM